jgi:hypothetical protein
MVQNLGLALKAEDFAGDYIQNQLVACFLVLIIDMLLAGAIQIIVLQGIQKNPEVSLADAALGAEIILPGDV